MTGIEAKSIVNAFDRIKRSAKERELALLNERSYRGVNTKNETVLRRDLTGKSFTYRGVTHTL